MRRMGECKRCAKCCEACHHIVGNVCMIYDRRDISGHPICSTYPATREDNEHIPECGYRFVE